MKKKKRAIRRASPRGEKNRSLVQITHWLTSIKTAALTAEADGAEVGACLLPDPAGGADMCVQVDAATCTRLKGTFQGGPCF
jgi:hypothetical protein